MLVFAGGALGTALRWAVDAGVDQLGWHVFVALLIVNVVGSFVLGWLVALPTSALHIQPLFAIGLLGSFTTFSGYTLAMVEEMDVGSVNAAAAFALGSIIVGYAAARLGRATGSVR